MMLIWQPGQLAADVRRLNNAIHRMTRIHWISVNKRNYAIRWILIYTLDVDSVIYLSNNVGLIIFCGWILWFSCHLRHIEPAFIQKRILKRITVLF